MSFQTSVALGDASPRRIAMTSRELIFHAYRITLVEKDWVTILTVVHGSRDLSRRSRPPWEVM
jgi:hypothetical protein